MSFHRPQDDGTDINFRNVGFYTSDAWDIPKRTQTTFWTRRKSKNFHALSQTNPILNCLPNFVIFFNVTPSSYFSNSFLSSHFPSNFFFNLLISYLSFSCCVHALPNFMTIIISWSYRLWNAPCSPSVAVVTRPLHGRLESASLIPGGGGIFVFATTSIAVLDPPHDPVPLVQGAVPRRPSSYPRHDTNHWPASSNDIFKSLELTSKNRTRP